MEIYGYRQSYLKTILTWLAILASGFILRLIFYWRPHWMLYVTSSRCSLEKAQRVLLIDTYGQYFVEKVSYLRGAPDPSTFIQRVSSKPSYGSLDPQLRNSQQELRYFENKKIRYIWNEDSKSFTRLRGLDKKTNLSRLQTMMTGLSKIDQWQRLQLYGDNNIRVEVQPYSKILFEEVLGPFYIFQLFSITLWFSDDYYYYGTCIIIMSIVSLVSSVIQIRNNQQQLKDTVESIDYVKVCRGQDEWEDVESSQLVPGDIVVVPTHDSVLQFDGILINGNVIVNESMLTGESVPVTKTPMPLANYSKQSHNDTFYDVKEHNKHTLFCGTKVMQTRYYGGVYVKALVTRTGFQTAKGELIRSIMFPKPVDFRFNKEIHKFIGVLACAALLGIIYTVIIMAHRNAKFDKIIIRALDLITIVIPPALPAAMTIGIIYAQSRLKGNRIFCISPRSINISGCINCVCFDKTGTLTEDNLSFNEVVPSIEGKSIFGRPFGADVMQTNAKQVERDHHLLLDNGEFSPLMVCLASCHSLTIIDDKIIGDPLDLQMFQATGWVLEEPDVDDENKFDLLAPTVVRPPRRKRRTAQLNETYESASEAASNSGSSSNEDELEVVSINTLNRCQKDVGILRQFPFSSSLQRMSVITRQFGGNQYVVYAKGAPEKIASLCEPSTVPENFGDILHGYTRKGFRVLALAYRPLKTGLSYTRMQRASRLEVERDLRFLGLLTLGNLLKPETIPVIRQLNRANIRSVMVTGDNMLTAISVALECGIMAPSDRTILLRLEPDGAGKTSGASSEATSPAKKATQGRSRASSLASSVGQRDQEELEMEVDSSTASTATIASETSQPTERQPQPIQLDVGSGDSIQLETRREPEPILRQPEPGSQAPRPRLVWDYVNDEQLSDSQSISPSSQQPLSSSQLAAYHQKKDDQAIRIPILSESKFHLALTGETWEALLTHYPELVNSVCVRATVFARMAPHQKQQLVEQLQSIGYFVGMCGDGANDSGALRSAHAGISLSDTEASVAAPFTSAAANISCVPILISEGRAALVTAFGILKYMASYSMIQFCSVTLLYTFFTNFTDMEFLYEDLFIIATLVAFFGRTEPYPSLDAKPPPSSLLSINQLASVAIQLVLVILFQVLPVLVLWHQPWYQEHPPVYDENLASHDNFAIFSMSAFQCISLAIIFSKGKPYRKSIPSNYLLTAALVIVTTLTVVVILIPYELNLPYISLEVPNVPLEFRLITVCLAFLHFLAATLGENFIVDHLIFRKSEKFFELFGVQSKLQLFEQIDRKTRSTNWLSNIC